MSSTATFTNSPLGTNVPIYDAVGPLESIKWPGGRTFLRPDLVGQYTVAATIVTSSSGSTNVTQTITAGTYMGVNTCALCHSGGVVAPKTSIQPGKPLRTRCIFTDGINGVPGQPLQRVLPQVPHRRLRHQHQCHRMMAGLTMSPQQTGWTFPTVLAPTNWAYMQAVYPSLANLGQHSVRKLPRAGQPARLHRSATPISSPRRSIPAIATNAMTPRPTTSMAPNGTPPAMRMTTGISGQALNCVGCHTANGFIARIEHQWRARSLTTTNTTFARDQLPDLP